ncbi:putative RNA-dependent RNA polymerase 1 [Trichoderma ghanense]|uniref:RNA-dependent RNA polymerase 1 n=1 Tax=Trichoderma ghanense TaxID=65468 RepID=A0ABY2H5K1_9HYPO
MPRAASSPKHFEHVLLDKISIDDEKWDFQVPKLPSAEAANALKLIKMVSLSTKDARHRLDLRYGPVDMNRAIQDLPLDRYLILSLAEFRSLRGASPSSSSEGAVDKVLQPTTARECSDYAVKLLKAGISIQGVHYNFYGHSNSQLKSRTCYLCAASKEEISKKVEALGDFTKMKTVAKKAKRIGLLFSVARAAMQVDPQRVQDIPDIEVGDFIFTDGCGLIAPHLAKELSRRTRIVFRNMRYTPSVFQIRYRGYKGVVTVDPTMAKGGPWLKMRKSMKKFSGGDDLSFSVVEYSKPYVFGHLNDEVVVLLDALGISRQTLLRKQQEHFDFLAQAYQNPIVAFRILCHLNMPEDAEKVIIDSLDAVRPTINRLVKAEYDKMLNKRDEQRCRILIPKSRLLFGVCDAWGVLKPGQCAVKVTMDGDGQPYALKGTKVLVTRNPCLHPGDLQKLDVVERPELAHLVDCIVFPTTGRRPTADMMSGGDLDGDTFFVTWDPDIIPTTISQAAHYPGVREPLRFSPITDEDRLVYFARYTNVSLGRVKNLYLKWARATGAMSAECQELNRLFSQCVDGNRIKEDHLKKFEKPPEPGAEAPPFVLDELHQAARDIITKQKRAAQTNVNDMEGYTFEGVQLLLSRDDVAISETELIRMAVRWCRRTNTSFYHLMHMFDLNSLKAEEKAWVLAQVPTYSGAPSLVYNALCSSSLLTEAELKHFHLNYPGLHWKRVYTSEQDRLATFLEAASKNLELFHKKMIVFRPDDRLTLAMYVPQKITPADDFKVGNQVRLFAFPHSQGRETQSRLSLPTKKEYRLFCDENRLQLFDGNVRNTWVFIGRGGSNDSSYRNAAREQDRRKARQESLANGTNFDYRASIALDKFSRNLQTHIGRLQRQGILAAEIYIISNRDVSSMRNLDLWEDYIGTEQTLPLFPREPKEYDIPKLQDIDWSLGAQPPLVVEVVRKGNLSALQDVLDPATLRELFAWLVEHEQRGLLTRCYEHLIASIKDDRVMAPAETLATMTDFVHRMPFVSATFANLGSWRGLPEDLRDIMQNSSLLLLRGIILSEAEFGELVLAPFHTILDNVEWLSLAWFADLVELVALTVHSSSTALDLLLEGLDRQSFRLLTGRPAIVQNVVHNMIGIAVEHIGAVQEEAKTRDELLNIRITTDDQGANPGQGTLVEVSFRIDAMGGTPISNTHVRLITASPPSSSIVDRAFSMDGLVVESRSGFAKIQCFHPPPTYVERCSWILEECGLFVTAKTMLDAVRDIAILEHACCGVLDQIVGTQPQAAIEAEVDDAIPSSIPSAEADASLNPSQRAAVEAAQRNKLICLWGPPGTGKTQTIVAIIQTLQSDPRTARILVTAPTHNAVDNVMRRYLKRTEHEGALQSSKIVPLRVATEVRKVGEDLRKYTCDALAGQEVHSSHDAMRKAKKRVKEAGIIFTTCIGAGLGLLRDQVFDTVIVDEASQQTEPASLVPLVKGCQKAILVGDHVQLRPTVQNIALALNFDVSLFERLYTRQGTTHGMVKVMLDTQYRMHPSICSFISKEFYEGKLLSGLQDTDRPMPPSSFPWPASSAINGSTSAPRMIFIECAGREDLGHKSKSNKEQADLCHSICKLLRTSPAGPSTETEANDASIAVLTPYSRQSEILQRLLSGIPNIEISSIDGFQGREADIVIFVTVRCNESREIGFLKDLRRMNVALTRAKYGMIVVGNRATLTGGREEEESTGMWRRLLADLPSLVLDLNP